MRISFSKTQLLMVACLSIILTTIFFRHYHPITAMRYDLGRHILLGQYIWENGFVPKTNLLSYSYPDYPFINSHWLFEVIAYLLIKTGGFPLLLTVSAFTIIFAFGAIFIYCSKRYPPLSYMAPAIIYMLASFERTDVRPENFSYLFLAITVALCYRYRERYTRFIYLLIPLSFIWVNTHIYFFLGLVVLSFFLIDLLFNKKHSFSSRIQLCAVLCLSGVATLLNPNGMQGALFPFTVNQNYGYPALENQGIFFHLQMFNNMNVIFFLVAVILLYTLLFITLRSFRLIDWLLAISFTTFSFMIMRNLPLFIFATFIPFTHALAKVLRSGSGYFKSYVIPKHWAVVRLLIYAFCLFGVAIILLKTFFVLPFGSAPVSGEEKAVTFLQKNNIRGPIFNNFDSGSYLAYRLFPKERIFVDGRTEAYPESFFTDEYLPVEKNPEMFAKLERKYKFNVIFFSHWDHTPWVNPFYSYIFSNKKYALVYLDDYAFILLKRNALNNPIINKFAIDRNSFSIPSTATPAILERYIYFFHKAGWRDKEKETLLALSMYKEIICTNDQEYTSINKYDIVSLCSVAADTAN